MQLFVDKGSSIVKLKDNNGKMGYDYLSKASKMIVEKYITEHNLNTIRPTKWKKND